MAPEFLRVIPVHNNRKIFQTSSVKYEHDDKPLDIRLVSCIHVGMRDYFREIKAEAERSDVILYENVRYPSIASARFIPATAGYCTQMRAIDYSSLDDRWVWCDSDYDTIWSHCSWSERFFLLLMRMSRLVGFNLYQYIAERLEDSPEFRAIAMLKLAAISSMSETSFPGIIGFRNRIVCDALQEQISRTLWIAKDGQVIPRSIAVFYGGGHMDGISKMVLANRFHFVSRDWFTAISS